MSHALCVILFFFFALGKRHDPSFLGKIRGNVLNTKYVAYDNGVHPTQKSTGIARRELAFINYTLLDDAPREMEVVVPKILSDGYASTHATNAPFYFFRLQLISLLCVHVSSQTHTTSLPPIQ